MTQDFREFRVHKALLGNLVHKVLKGHQELQVGMDRGEDRDPMVLSEKMDLLALLGLQVLLDPRDLLVQAVTLDQSETQEVGGHLDLSELTGNRDCQAPLDPKGLLDRPDLLENKDCKDLLVLLDQKETLAKWVPRDCWGRLVNPAKKA